MANDAAHLLTRFRATVNGRDISPAIAPVLIGIRIRDAAGQASDTAEIQLDDAGGSILFPRPGARLQVELRDQNGLGLAFVGQVDEPRSRGDRTGGRILTISAKGADVLGRAKQLQEKHFDDATIGEALAAAGELAGISTVRIDPGLASIRRAYIAMEGESFLAFGQRLARELGGTFKVVGDRALLVKRNGGTTASGLALATIKAEFGRNLISWDIAPFASRPRHKRARTRHYDPDAAQLQERSATLADESTDADQVGRYLSADAAEAQDQANASAGEIERSSGSGTVTIECDTRAKPEGVCSVIGARDGVDGDYRIDAVEHALDRSGGTVTQLDLGQPHGKAGKDGRKPTKAAADLKTLSFQEN